MRSSNARVVTSASRCMRGVTLTRRRLVTLDAGWFSQAGRLTVRVSVSAWAHSVDSSTDTSRLEG